LAYEEASRSSLPGRPVIMLNGWSIPALTARRIDPDLRNVGRWPWAGRRPPASVRRDQHGQLADTPSLIASSRALLQAGPG
jgi:hypothetical protein